MRNNFSPTTALVLLMLLLSGVSGAMQDDASRSATSDSERLDTDGAAAIANFEAQVVTLQGRFEQTVTDADGRIKERSTGYLKLLRPGRFLWVYETPYEQRIVADGENLWLYDIDLDQVSVRAQQEALGRSPAEILSGAADALAGFDYQGSFMQDGTLWAQLAATDAGSDFRAIRLGFIDGTLAGMELGDSLGQVSRIVFLDVDTEAPIDGSVFEFVPPDGVDVIGTPAGMPQANPAPVPVVPGLG